jgi:HlyD family secretion protein
VKRILVILLLALILAAAAAAWYTQSSRAAIPALSYSGALEAEQIAIVPEIGGRVTDIRIKGGDTVNAGDILVMLDTALLDAKIQQAEAAVAAANANLAQLLTGTRPEEIAAAEGALEQAVAAREGAQKAFDDVCAIRANPQTLNTQIVAAQGQLGQANAQVKQAQANADYAKRERDRYAEGSSEYKTADGKYRAALAQLEAAQAARDGAQKASEDLFRMRAKPIALDAQVNAAQMQLNQATAQVAQAQAALDALEAGATEEQIAMARAKLKQAEAALALLQIQRDKLTLRAPITGVVVQRAVNLGEMASAGATLLTIANLDAVKLTVYVPEAQLGRVALNQNVRVKIDAYPQRAFAGRVVFTSPQAEFTPKNAQTAQERAMTVFAVKLTVDNRNRALTMGMTGEVLIGE